MTTDNIDLILSIFVTELGIPITTSSIRNEVKKHPDNTSLLAISDLLDNWNVPNMAYNVDFEQLKLVDLTLPFIAFTKGRQFVVAQKDAEEIVVIGRKKKRSTLTFEDFNSIYGGTILIAKKVAEAGEKDYSQKLIKQQATKIIRIIFISYILVSIAVISAEKVNFNSRLGLEYCSLILVKIAGIVVSVILLAKTLNYKSKIFDEICGTEENKSCNAILSSDASKILGLISWAEIGFFYFCGSLLFTVSAPLNSDIFFIDYALSLLSLPIILLSLYYQLRKRQACVLCCIVQGLLFCEFLILHSDSHELIITGLESIIPFFFISFFAPVITWYFLKPVLTSLQRTSAIEKQLFGIKFNPSVFQAFLNSTPPSTILPSDESIVLGEINCTWLITIVSNPFCAPCSIAHQKLHKLLSPKNDVKLQILFFPYNPYENDSSLVTAHLMAIYYTQDQEITKQALLDWHMSNKDYRIWADKYPVKEISSYSDVLLKQSQWCLMTNVKETPTIFLNGRKLPKEYSLEDLSYIL